MAGIAGLNVVPMAVPNGGGSQGGSPQGQRHIGGTTAPVPTVIDGTPLRVVILGFAAAGALWSLHLAGLRFHLGVSA